MAATRSTSQGGDSDSSSGGEDLERFREATWEPPGSVKKTVQFLETSPSPVVPSLRVHSDNYEHCGNELKTTPEFRSHVAKKLAAILDSCIKEIPGSNCFNEKSTAASDEDEGFRLLTTSVPGDSGKIIPSLTLKRRVASSTSDDSEEEKQRRCREAAVSGLDILRHSALQTTPVEIIDTASSNHLKKKKKKKKAKMERRQDYETETDDQNMEPPEGNKNGFKKRRKKKDRRMSDETQSYDQKMEPEGKMNGFKKKKKNDRVINSESDDQTIHPEPKRESKKNKTGSDHHNKPETVKDLFKNENKEIGLSATSSDQNMNSVCGKNGTKKKEKR